MPHTNQHTWKYLHDRCFAYARILLLLTCLGYRYMPKVIDTHLPHFMQHNAKALPQEPKQFILLTRHSIRQEAAAHHIPSGELQLTVIGKTLAKEWGEWLHQHCDLRIISIATSPVQRCVDTGLWMLQGQRALELKQPVPFNKSPDLVEPGCFIEDSELAGPLFLKMGALSFVNSLLQNTMMGSKNLLHVIYQHLYSFFLKQHRNTERGIQLVVTHDTVLMTFIAVLTAQQHVEWEDWPHMLEGAWLWFDGEYFDHCMLHFYWREHHYTLNMAELITLIE